MNPALTGPAAALFAGVLTSLHCAGMCGPLACAACARPNGPGSLTAASAYHACRLVSYAVVGFLAGGIGRAVSDVLLGGATRWLTWAFVGFFVLVATGLDKRLTLPLAGRWMAACLGNGDAAPVRAAILGTLSPFIPCGPLYLIVAAAALSGSAASGAAVLLAFGAGTVPLMLALQSQVFRLGSRFSPLTLDLLRRGLAAASVAVLVYRGLANPAFLCR